MILQDSAMTPVSSSNVSENRFKMVMWYLNFLIQSSRKIDLRMSLTLPPSQIHDDRVYGDLLLQWRHSCCGKLLDGGGHA